MTRPSRWEQGSEFHWMPASNEPEAAPPWDGGAMLFGTARDALRGLLADGSTRRGWRRLWIPSYFCQDVVASLRSTGIVLVTYTDDPENPLTVGNARFLPGDALLVVNYFGLRGMPSYDRLLPDTVAIIEDHTHDPWSVWAMNSEADWCVASLRKTLPVPDGAVLWSPVGHPLFSEPALTVDRRAASLEKLAAMALKALYLEGLFGDKEFFRRLAISGEGRIASGDVSGITEWTRALLRTFPTGTWRERRRENHRVLLSAIGGIPWATVLRPQDAVDVCPFSGIVLFDSAERRDHVRECLMASRVYPTILWPLESLALPGIPPKNVDFSRRMLSIHCDMRYSRADMLRVAEMIRLI